MAERILTDEQKAELQSGDGYYYVTQGMAGHVGDWPDVVKHPKSKMLRLVKRQVVKMQTEADIQQKHTPGHKLGCKCSSCWKNDT